jgi:hypothetical protein
MIVTGGGHRPGSDQFTVVGSEGSRRDQPTGRSPIAHDGD